MIDSILNTLIWLPGIIVALTFHEYAHGKVADYLGDNTPYYQGRLTLNPLPHIDWVGFLMLLFFKFGWAKPVQVNPYNFRKVGIKKGMMLVSLAGPLMNLILAAAGMAFSKFLLPWQLNEWVAMFMQLLFPFVYINLILAAFNLLPVPPLDGYKILTGLLPDAGANFLYSLEQYGPLILLLLVVSGTTGQFIGPIINIMYGLLSSIIY